MGDDVEVIDGAAHEGGVLHAVDAGTHLDGVRLLGGVGVLVVGALEQGGGHVTLDVGVVAVGILRGHQLGFQDADDAVGGGAAVAYQGETTLAGLRVAGIELNGHGDHGGDALHALAQQVGVDGLELVIVGGDVGEGDRGRRGLVVLGLEIDLAADGIAMVVVGEGVAVNHRLDGGGGSGGVGGNGIVAALRGDEIATAEGSHKDT